MSSEWKTASIDELKAPRNGSIAIGPFGSRMKSDCYVNDGVSVIRGTNLMGGRELSGEFVFITEEKAAELGNSNVLANDLVFPHRGSIGEVGIVPNDGNKYVLSSSLMKLSCDTSKVDPLFIYYFFKSSAGRFELLKNASQVGTPGIGQPLTSLKSIEMRYPLIETQKCIVGILTSLDDRITLLRETNTTLEAIAQALFKSWFVNFDPVLAKQEGREPEGMDADTAALFPDSFEELELGLVPKGWNQVPFTDTVHVIGGGTPKTSVPEYWNGDIPWFSVVDAPTITDVFVIDTQKHITEQGLNNSSTKLLAKGTTIISARGTVGRLALVGRQMAMNQSCYGLRGKADDAYFTYFSTYRLVESLKQRSHGSVFDTITTETMRGVFVIYPGKAVIKAFEALLQPVMDCMQNNLETAQTLATLRDTLLPRLISGQLRLPDAEAVVGEV